MERADDYIQINRASWNARVEHHLTSPFYDLEGFKNGRCSLNEIELDLLGDVRGKSILHLQCHFGQDSLSLARRGAHVTAVDFSEKAIEAARALAHEMHLDVRFVCCDVYSLNKHINQQFDLVFTSYGTIGWLPDLDRWADIVSHFTSPKGHFVFAEFHPVLWMLDDTQSKIFYPYSSSQCIADDLNGTYADKEADLSAHRYVSWNHGLAEVIFSLLKKGLHLQHFEEFDYSPYNIFDKGIEVEKGRFQVRGLEGILPLVYALKAVKSDLTP